MLHEFLVANRAKILALAKEKTAALAAGEEEAASLPQFYEHLARELETEVKQSPVRSRHDRVRNSTEQARRRLSPLGYTVSQVVRGYGVLGQAVIELARASKSRVAEHELNRFNRSLDAVIAEAVTERIGYLVHELRNALAAATVAHSMVKKGVAGTATNAVLERNLNRMRDVLDHSFNAMRMQHGRVLDRQPLLVSELVEEVRATAGEEARMKGLTLKTTGNSEKINADRHYMISALSNLVQNAIKYSKKGGVIWIRSRVAGKNVVIEVEDHCGGLPEGKTEELFMPFVQKNSDRSGLGLGLTIARDAAALNGGELTARNLPGKGCVFSITLPKLAAAAPAEKAHAPIAHRR